MTDAIAPASRQAARRAEAGRGSILILVVIAPIVAMTIDWLNPALLPQDGSGTTGNAKWFVMAMSIAAGLTLSARARHLLRHPPGPVAKLFLAFLSWSFLTTVVRAGLDLDLVFKWMSVAAVYVLSFVVAPGIINRPRDAHQLLWALALFGMTVLGLSAFLFVFRNDETMVMGRFTGAVFSARTLSVILGMFIPIAFCLALSSTGGRRACHGAIAAVGVAALSLTGSRAEILSLFAAMIVLVYGAYKGGKLKGVALGLAAFTIGASAVSVSLTDSPVDFHDGFLRDVDSDTDPRLEVWRSSARILTEDPPSILVGIGFGVVWKTYYARLGRVEPTETTAMYDAHIWKLLHNSYLEVLVETGIVGLTLMLLILWKGVRSCLWLARAETFSGSLVHYGLLSVLIAGLVSVLFDSVLLPPGGVFSLWFWPTVGVYSRLHRDALRSGEVSTLEWERGPRGDVEGALASKAP